MQSRNSLKPASQTAESRLNLLAGEKEGLRGAVLESLDAIPALLAGLREELSAAAAPGGGETSGGLDELTGLEDFLTPERLEQPIELPEKLREAVRAMPSRKTVELDLGEFLSRLAEQRVLPYEAVSDVPPAVKRKIAILFAVYKASERLLTEEEEIYTREQVAAARERGDYIEVPEEGRSFLPPPADDRPTCIHVERVEGLARKRIYRLPFDEYPDFHYFAETRETYLAHLIRSAAELGAASE